MQISLNQTEIESALKDYVAKQGIRLQGRVVSIEFTSGRKENGVSADLCISDDAGDFPVFTSEEVQASTLNTLVGSIAPAQDTESDAAETESVLVSAEYPPIKPTSLFGS